MYKYFYMKYITNKKTKHILIYKYICMYLLKSILVDICISNIKQTNPEP